MTNVRYWRKADFSPLHGVPSFRGKADMMILRRSVPELERSLTFGRKAEFTWMPRNSPSAMANALSFFSSGGI